MTKALSNELFHIKPAIPLETIKISPNVNPPYYEESRSDRQYFFTSKCI